MRTTSLLFVSFLLLCVLLGANATVREAETPSDLSRLIARQATATSSSSATQSTSSSSSAATSSSSAATGSSSAATSSSSAATGSSSAVTSSSSAATSSSSVATSSSSSAATSSSSAATSSSSAATSSSSSAATSSSSAATSSSSASAATSSSSATQPTSSSSSAATSSSSAATSSSSAATGSSSAATSSSSAATSSSSAATSSSSAATSSSSAATSSSSAATSSSSAATSSSSVATSSSSSAATTDTTASSTTAFTTTSAPGGKYYALALSDNGEAYIDSLNDTFPYNISMSLNLIEELDDDGNVIESFQMRGVDFQRTTGPFGTIFSGDVLHEDGRFHGAVTLDYTTTFGSAKQYLFGTETVPLEDSPFKLLIVIANWTANDNAEKLRFTVALDANFGNIRVQTAPCLLCNRRVIQASIIGQPLYLEMQFVGFAIKADNKPQPIAINLRSSGQGNNGNYTIQTPVIQMTTDVQSDLKLDPTVTIRQGRIESDDPLTESNFILIMVFAVGIGSIIALIGIVALLVITYGLYKKATVGKSYIDLIDEPTAEDTNREKHAAVLQDKLLEDKDDKL